MSVKSNVLNVSTGLNFFSPISQLHYTLIEPPVITGDYIDLDLNAVFTLMGKPLVSLARPPPFSLPLSSGSGDSVVVLGISEHLLNSVLAMAQQFGSFNFHVFRQTIAHQFPHPEPIGLKVTVRKAPIVTFFEGKAILSLHPSIEVVAAASWTSASRSLFTLEVDVALVLRFAVTEVTLQASVSPQGGLRFVLVSSRVGSVNVSWVTCLIASAFEEALVAQLNAVLSIGINLPCLDNIKYVHPRTEVHKGYAAVSCGLDYAQ
ncbi:PREDICTED: BPI fold-containing family B member 2 [Gavialis gangeticus]|uniref:BPI fold-containing family B member 2 n=1 Tax=Gavialis gangeticus TaxID=94835 RepID=UPI00092E740C|nr:PREDICTED: BPI fold-containing family B member 2 [Gavialis gangeticus]